MNILIVYTSKYGTTEKAVQLLEKKLKGNTQTLNLKRGRMPEIEKYDFIIIGGPIYMGRPEKKLQEFCEVYASKLKEKKIGLFLCCGHVGEKAQQQMEKAFTSELLQHAKVPGAFGGEIHQDELKFLDKMAIVINVI